MSCPRAFLTQGMFLNHFQRTKMLSASVDDLLLLTHAFNMKHCILVSFHITYTFISPVWVSIQLSTTAVLDWHQGSGTNISPRVHLVSMILFTVDC